MQMVYESSKGNHICEVKSFFKADILNYQPHVHCFPEYFHHMVHITKDH